MNSDEVGYNFVKVHVLNRVLQKRTSTVLRSVTHAKIETFLDHQGILHLSPTAVSEHHLADLHRTPQKIVLVGSRQKRGITPNKRGETTY